MSLRKHGYSHEVLWPKVRTRKGGRAISAFIRYTVYMLQIVMSRADIYWVANAPDVVAIPLFILQRKYIYDFRSVWSKEIETEMGRGIWPRLARIIETLAMRNARIIVLNSDTFLEDAKPYNKPLFLVPNYPRKNFRPAIPRQEFRQMHGVSENSEIVLLVARLTKVEGADMIPRLTERLSKQSKIKLWIVGAGALQDLIRRLEKRFPDHLEYFGWQKYDQIPNFINASDVCIVPRHHDHNSHYYNEINVQKISEYMLFRKPIVASGIAPSSQYLLVDEDNLVDGILEALKGNAPDPTPRTWEDDAEPELLRTLRAASVN